MSDGSQNNIATGIFWMFVTGLLFVGVTGIVRHIGTELPAAQNAFLRYLLGVVFLIPMIRPLMAAELTPKDWKLFILRGAAHTVGVTCWFYAMARTPIAEVTALNYMSPVYVTIGAAIFLGERLAFRRVFAISLALVGAIVILRPGFRELGSGHLAMILAALFFAISYLLVKVMSGRHSAVVVVAMLSITVPIGLAPLALMVWVTPTLEQLAWIFVVAMLATAAHYTMTLGLAAAPLSATQPVTFLQLVWAVLIGSLVFGEAVDIWVIGGGGLIIGAVSFMAWREARLKRNIVTPPDPATKF